MRKLLNRKGFSLIELMIVVVIMGILIAIAVPLYSAVTENAEKRTCQDNQRAIRAVYSRYILTDEVNETNRIFKDGYISFNGAAEEAQDVFKEDFLAGFDDGNLPHCPVHGNYYTVSFSSDVDIVITCSHANHNI